jgi:hypothetical protein
VLVHGRLDVGAAWGSADERQLDDGAPDGSDRQRDPSWLREAHAGTLSADALLTHYVRHVHDAEGTYEGTARRLGLDRRTVRARVVGLVDGSRDG